MRTLNGRTFRGTTVAEAAGIDAVQLNAWRDRGVLKLDQPEQDGPTRYTVQDLMRVVVLAELSRIFVSPTGGRFLLAEKAVSEMWRFEALGGPSENIVAMVPDVKVNGKGRKDPKVVSVSPSHIAGQLKRKKSPRFLYVGRPSGVDPRLYEEEAAVGVFINVPALWRRTVARLRDLNEMGGEG